MKIEIDKDVLERELKIFADVIAKKETVPALAYIKFNAFGDSVSLIGGDGYKFLSVEMPCKVLESGATLINYQSLFALVKTFGAGPIILKKTERNIKVSWGSYKGTVGYYPDESFPPTNKPDHFESLCVSGVQLANMFQRSSLAVLGVTVQKQWIVAGARFFVDQHIEIAGFTGEHAIVTSFKKEQPKAQTVDAIIPDSACVALRKICSDVAASPVEFAEYGNYLYFRAGHRVLQTRIIVENFAKYQQLYPADASKFITIERAVMMSALRRISLSADKLSRRAYAEIIGNQLELKSQSSENSQTGVELIAIENPSGVAMKIAFNCDVMTNAFFVIEDDNVFWHIPEDGRPMFLWSDGDHDIECKQIILGMNADN